MSAALAHYSGMAIDAMADKLLALEAPTNHAEILAAIVTAREAVEYACQHWADELGWKALEALERAESAWGSTLAAEPRSAEDVRADWHSISRKDQS